MSMLAVKLNITDTFLPVFPKIEWAAEVLAAQAGAHIKGIAVLQATGGGTERLAVRAHVTWPFAAGKGAENMQSGGREVMQVKLKGEVAEDEEAAAGLYCRQVACTLGAERSAPPSPAC